MQFTGGVHLLLKVTNRAENLVLQALQLRQVSGTQSQAEQTQVITELMRALWRVHLMVVLNCLLLKALAVIFSICSLDVILMSNITSRYFERCLKGMFCPFNVRRISTGFRRWEKQMT